MSRTPKEESKVMSLRLGVNLYDQIAAVARTDEMPITETIRAAIHHYIDARCGDPEFQDRRKKRMEEDLRVLKGLGEREASASARVLANG